MQMSGKCRDQPSIHGVCAVLLDVLVFYCVDSLHRLVVRNRCAERKHFTSVIWGMLGRLFIFIRWEGVLLLQQTIFFTQAVRFCN